MYHDLTLRDGSHAIKHQLTEKMIIEHCIFAENAGIEVVEIGHGNGLGASSILIGKSLLTDFEMLNLARKYLKKTKLSVHIIPGIATIKDIDMAISLKVDIFRIACHCTEATVTKSYIEYLNKKGLCVYGVLMMSALCSKETLYEEASKMKSYGASSIIIMDSTGSYDEQMVIERISFLKTLNIPLGFHAHNNYQLAVSNSLKAIEAGASIIDVTLKGFGAGAGNTPLEIMVLKDKNTKIDKEILIDYCDKVKTITKPDLKPIHLLTAEYKLFSGFEKHIIENCKKYNLSYLELIKELYKNNLVAGQEDIIRVIASTLK